MLVLPFVLVWIYRPFVMFNGGDPYSTSRAGGTGMVHFPKALILQGARKMEFISCLTEFLLRMWIKSPCHH